MQEVATEDHDYLEDQMSMLPWGCENKITPQNGREALRKTDSQMKCPKCKSLDIVEVLSTEGESFVCDECNHEWK